MEKTPLSLRTHISIFGNTNAGKSSLFNALLGQPLAIVSERRGTTADPVTKALELIPYGPIALTDTAGLGDDSPLGEKRMEKTEKILNQTDFALYAMPVNDTDISAYEKMKAEFEKKRIPHMLVLTKADTAKSPIQNKFPESIAVSINDSASIELLRSELIKRLTAVKSEEKSMIGTLLPAGSTVVLVTPIDSEAPKGRLILPQVQLIRDCLDNGMTAVVTRETELEKTLSEQTKIDLVVTDSQVFKLVSAIVPEEIPLTSFSMLTANMKGDLCGLIKGAEAIDTLRDGSRILMAEACTHNSSHEDIGRVKIPRLLRSYTKRQLEFDYFTGCDFPDNLSDYDLVIHCGGCMLNSRTMKNRQLFCAEHNIPVTNYGVAIAYANGILKRASQIFTDK